MPPPWEDRHRHHHHSPHRPIIEVDIASPFARPPPPRVTTEVVIMPNRQPRPAEVIYVPPPRPRQTEVVYVAQPQQRPPPQREVVIVESGNRPPIQPEHWDNRPRW